MTLAVAHTVACASPVSNPEPGLGAPATGGASSPQEAGRAREGRILVGKEGASGAWMAIAVPMKGGAGMFAIDKCGEFINENGDRRERLLSRLTRNQVLNTWSRESSIAVRRDVR